jgi:predicted amidohydrolase
MPRKVRVTTTSFAFLGPRSVEGNRTSAAAYVDAAGAERADLVCLPETLLHAGIPRADRPMDETVPGPTFDLLAERARANRVNVVAGLVERRGDRRENVAVVIDRDGQLVGRYSKIHPTTTECELQRITPGCQTGLVDLDVGRIGLAICFDVGWPRIWQDLSEGGAELVVWPSAYDGGFPLQVYAWTHFYYVVSSVWGQHSKVIDITGRVLASTSRWNHLTSATIDLEKRVFHIDDQVAKLHEIQTRYGARVTAVGCSEENVFTLESNDPALPLDAIAAEFGLESFRDYHARATLVQDRHRTAPEPAPAREAAG